MSPEEKQKLGRKKKPGCRQVSFWSTDAKARRCKRAAKKAGYSSRSKWLDDVTAAAAKAVLAKK